MPSSLERINRPGRLLLGVRAASSQDTPSRFFRRIRRVRDFEDAVGVRNALQTTRLSSLENFGDTLFRFRPFPNPSRFVQREHLNFSVLRHEYPIPSGSETSYRIKDLRSGYECGLRHSRSCFPAHRVFNLWHDLRYRARAPIARYICRMKRQFSASKRRLRAELINGLNL